MAYVSDAISADVLDRPYEVPGWRFAVPFEIPASRWAATPLADVQKRLQKLDSVLRSSKRADGSVDLVEAKALARELIQRAAQPTHLKDGESPLSKETNSLAARLEAEKKIAQLAEFSAATPEGAEALKWAMRLAIAQGECNYKNSPVFDAGNHSERDWKAYVPFLGNKHLKGRGHLSDAELVMRFGPLKAFSERTAQEVNSLLLMDYKTGFLAGKDLPERAER